MARHVNRLTARAVAAARKPGRLADGNGLYLNVSDTGAKSWRLIYYYQRKRRELGLGSANTTSLADARARAFDARKLLDEGKDPKEVWRPAPTVDTTFGAVALDFIEGLEAGWKNAKHRKQWRNTLRTYAQPIWDKPVADVDVADLLAILRPIWTSKAETASRVRGRIERVLDAAKVRGLRSGENPALWRGNLSILLPAKKKGPKRHHPAMPFAALPAFMAKLASRPGLAARALELTILTAARTSETLHARWPEFDLEEKLWTVPAERMKAGKEHRVPLSDCAVAMLEALPRVSEFVFPGLKPEKPLSNMAMEMVLRRMKVEDTTVHGFRSTFRDWCGEMTDFPREVAEQALAHTVGNEVERAYRRGDALSKRRELMAQWAAFARASVPSAKLDAPKIDPKLKTGSRRALPNTRGREAGISLSRSIACGQSRPRTNNKLAETEGFEPSVGVIPLRRFSKPLVSATHPRLRAGSDGRL
jgi:integrase